MLIDARASADSHRRALITIAASRIDKPAPLDLARLVDPWTEHDWRLLCQEAVGESLDSWVTHRLSLWSLNCPAEVLAKANAQASVNAHWARFHMSLTTELAERFQQQNVSVRVIKGHLVGLAVYGDVSLRNSGDIDIVVSPRDVSRAAKVLIDSGLKSSLDASWFADDNFLSTHREASFTDLDGAFDVDLHWTLNYPWVPAVITVDKLFSLDAPTTQYGGTTFPWMENGTLWLVHLANILNTQRPELKAYVDLVHISDALERKDWAQIWRACARPEAAFALTAVCFALDNLFGRNTVSVISRPLSNAPSKRKARALGQSIVKRLMTSCLDEGTPSSVWENTQFISTWRQRYAFAKASMYPSISDYENAAPGASFASLLFSATRRRLANAVER